MNETNKTSGPVFESGPGWGKKFGQFMDEYFLAVIAPLMVIALTLVAVLLVR